jgi:hypothetical protein
MISMLTLIAYQFALGNSVPRISYLTRLDIFMLGSVVLVFLALVRTVITGALTNRGHVGPARTINYHSRWIFPLAFLLITAVAAL